MILNNLRRERKWTSSSEKGGWLTTMQKRRERRNIYSVKKIRLTDRFRCVGSWSESNVDRDPLLLHCQHSSVVVQRCRWRRGRVRCPWNHWRAEMFHRFPGEDTIVDQCVVPSLPCVVVDHFDRFCCWQCRENKYSSGIEFAFCKRCCPTEWNARIDPNDRRWEPFSAGSRDHRFSRPKRVHYQRNHWSDDSRTTCRWHR